MDIAPADDANAAAPLTDAEEARSSAEGELPLALLPATGHDVLRDKLLAELWERARAETVEVTDVEFGAALQAIGAKHNFGLEPQTQASAREREAFWRGLHLEDLALAMGCARGREAAWRQFMKTYEDRLMRAAVGMTGSSALGEELAGALYSELYGVTAHEAVRRSPLERYSGRGSLMGWLRAMLAQRQVDHYRKTRRESPLEDLEPAAPEGSNEAPANLVHLRAGLQTVLKELGSEERFLLSAYYLDTHTLAELSRVLRVHEATVSRKLKRITEQVRKELLRTLQARGLSRRAAEEALGTDPRDVDVNLRKLLQIPEGKAYSNKEGRS
jgi:RNA polymerase sigma-70 factor (ECF subfamily)